MADSKLDPVRRRLSVRRRAAAPAAPDGPADAAAVDARYGLEPVFEPGGSDSELGGFITVDCPYCGERYETPIDLTAGSFSYIEDCQICCRPIELSGDVDEAGVLERCAARRLD